MFDKKRKGNRITASNTVTHALPKELNINLWVEKGCTRGDFDVLTKGLLDNGQESFLFTIESLGEGKPLFKTKVRLNGLAKPFNIKIPASKLAQQNHLGMYVCSDIKNTGSCNDKRPIDNINESQNLGDTKKSKANKISGDRTYIFQYMKIHPDDKKLTLVKTDFGENYFQALESVVGDNERFRQIQSLIAETSPIPIKMVNADTHNYLDIKLMQFNKSACFKTTKDKHKEAVKNIKKFGSPIKPPVEPTVGQRK